jgi:chemotaxis family two-component system response regulator Rcp1
VFANKSVYIIEDDALELFTLSNLLDQLAVHYTRNTSGADAVAQLRELEPHPDAILLDTDLPRANAFTIYDALQAEPHLNRIPVVIMAESDRRQQIMPDIEARDFAGLIPKPISEKALTQVLRQVFSAD